MRDLADSSKVVAFMRALGSESRGPGFIERHGLVDFFHYDFRGQALSKIERGHAQDVGDVQQMLARGLVTAEQLRAAFLAIEPRLLRYPSIDRAAFARKLAQFVGPA